MRQQVPGTGPEQASRRRFSRTVAAMGWSAADRSLGAPGYFSFCRVDEDAAEVERVCLFSLPFVPSRILFLCC